MAYVLPEDLQQAKRMDLLTYLQTFEPQELVRVSGNTYCTREHDSLKISNGMWHWFSRKIGGKSALDYLILVRGLTLPQAVEQILGRAAVVPPSFHAPQKGKESAKLLLPDRAPDNRIITRYLRDRGIHPEILDYCYRNRLIFESLPYHSAVFVGYDESGTPRHANIRSTKGSFKGDATGSDKHYSFHIPALSDHVHIFEAAIDLLSYATTERMAGSDWQQDHLLSLAGVFQTKRKDVVPVALQRYLEAHPNIRTLHLHLDNDEVGRGAASGIISTLGGKYIVLNEPPAYGKDMNDLLVQTLHRRKEWER